MGDNPIGAVIKCVVGNGGEGRGGGGRGRAHSNRSLMMELEIIIIMGKKIQSKSVWEWVIHF